MRWFARSGESGSDGDRQIARACALVVGMAAAWTAESYESELNVSRPAVLAVAAPAPPQRHGASARLVWVLVDGLRLDASRRMPVLNRLRAEGVDVVARSEFPSYSGPNYVAQASGIEPAAAGVLSNGYPEELRLDSVFRRAKLAGLRTAVVTTDDDESLRDPYRSWIDESRRADTLERLPSADLLLVHIDYPDEAAHDYGTRSPEYRESVARVDAFLGRLVQTFDPARDVLVFSSDHGNLTRGGHGGTEPEVEKIPIVFWGAGVLPDPRHRVSRGRDVAPTIASLLGVGPLRHATGRPIIGGDEPTARQRTAVWRLVGEAGRRPTHHLPMTVLVAVGTLAMLARRSGFTTRALASAATYPFVFGALLVTTHTVSFSMSNLTVPFAFRLTAFCAVAGLAQLLVGGRDSLTLAALATSLAVLAVAVVAAFEPVAPADGMLRFLPIPALTCLAFICLLTAAIATPERVVADDTLGEEAASAGAGRAGALEWAVVVDRALPEADGAFAQRRHSGERGHVE
jgi:hypothetical protein